MGNFLPTTPSHFLKVFVLFAVYLITAKIGLSLHPVSGFATLIWPPTGIALAALFLYGYRLWPGVALGALTVNMLVGASAPVAAGIAFGNTLEALAGAFLLREYLRLQDPFGRLRDALGFTAVALIVPTLSATIGTASLALGGILTFADLYITWVAWWTGDALGALVLTPFLIQFLSHPPNLHATHLREELNVIVLRLGIFTLLAASAIFIFWTDTFPLPYPVFLPFLIVLLATNPRYTSLGSLILASIAILGTLAGYGPFASYEAPLSFLLLQTFLGVSIIMFSVTSSALEERRGALSIVRSKNDELEQALRKLASDDRAKNEFLATLSHELRNPLAPVVNTLEMMRLRAHELQPPEILDHVGVIHTHLRTVVRLLDDLLDVSRITRKKIELHREPVILQKAVAQATETVRATYHTRKHSITVSSPNAPYVIDADPVRLQQILVNILGNAAKYTDPGGQIHISIVNDPDRGCRIGIRDSGLGIDPTMLEAIFEPFTQLKNQKESDYSTGLGIGLSITKQLVELHDGKIWAESAGAGRGTEIIFVLPPAGRAPGV